MPLLALATGVNGGAHARHLELLGEARGGFAAYRLAVLRRLGDSVRPDRSLDRHLRSAARSNRSLARAARHRRAAHGVLAAPAGGVSSFGSVAGLSHRSRHGPPALVPRGDVSCWRAREFAVVLGVVLIVGGILLVSGLTSDRSTRRRKPAWRSGCIIGVFIAGYTINDGWAVKVLMMSPFLVDFTGNLLRIVLLAPMGATRPGRADARSAGVPELE